MGEQQRLQAERLRLVGHQLRDHRGQPDRLGAQRAAHVGVAGACRVALVEHEVDDVQRGRQALGQRLVRRHRERDARGADLRLGPHESLRHGGLGHEERVRDLGCRQAAQQPQRQRHLRLGRERRVTAGEDQPQPLVGHARRHGLLVGGLVVGRRDGRESLELRCALAQHAIAAQPVDRPIARDHDDPRRRVARNALERPALHRGDERILHRLLGKVPVADGADQRRDRPPEVLPKQAIDSARCRSLAQDAAPSAEAASRA